MSLAVLSATESWYLRDLQRAAADDFCIVPATFRELQSDLSTASSAYTSGDVDLRAVDAVLVRTMPPGSLEQVVFRMDVLGQLEAAGKIVLNPPRSLEAAVDKYLASAKLAKAGLPTPRTRVCQTADDAMQAFAQFQHDAVIKPLFGAEGRGITRLQDEALALRAFRMLEQLGAVIYLQEYIPHAGADLRLLVLGDRVLGMRRVTRLIGEPTSAAVPLPSRWK